MTPEERLQKIESYGSASALLLEALKEFPEEMWQFRDEHGCWSIHEHIVHVTDSEANSYIRCRRLIAEQGEPLMAYDENQWASSLSYHEQSVDDALALFKWLRHTSYTLIKTLPEQVWAHTSFHPENGRRAWTTGWTRARVTSPNTSGTCGRISKRGRRGWGRAETGMALNASI